MNECSACGQNFGSITAFDAHQIGRYPQTGPAYWFDRVRAGWVEAGEEWKPTAHFGRRCLEEDELEADPRFSRGRNGWSLTRSIQGGKKMRGEG
jgi:hypothetical protein